MNNLENLNYLKKIIESGDNLSQKMRFIVSDIVESEINKYTNTKDPFVYFYEDVTGKKLTVAFKNIIPSECYSNASEHAKVCLAICTNFKELPNDARIGAWLVDALKYADYLILHYIQEIRLDKINPKDYQRNLKLERRRYEKLKTYEKPISDAGAWLESLYKTRSSIQHNTTVHKKSGKHILELRPFKRIRKDVAKKYPALLSLIMFIYEKETA